MKKKRKVLRMHGIVQKLIKPLLPRQPERAQIDIHEADDLYREIRVENVLKDRNGNHAALKEGAQVDIVLEADSDATIEKLPHEGD